MKTLHDPTFVSFLVLSCFFHVIYNYRNEFAWARKSVDFVRRLYLKPTDHIVLFMAVLIDVFLVIIFMLQSQHP